MKKKILIFTGSRADYGLLKPLISRIKKDKRYKFLIAAGSHHFSKNLGFTYKEIEKKIKKILFSNLKIKFDDIYYKKNTSILMFNKIKNILNKKNHTKKFYDAA